MFNNYTDKVNKLYVDKESATDEQQLKDVENHLNLSCI